MYKIENHCCDCGVLGYPCIGKLCELRTVKVFYCDRCKKQTSTLVDVFGEELCLNCAKEEND